MRDNQSKRARQGFHVEGWHPAFAATAGALSFLGVGLIVLGVLQWATGSTLESSWALPVFVTAIGAGGAAGIAVKNLNLRRAASRRDTNLMFDSQFETGARLLGGHTESEVVAGSLLIGSLLRESSRHAQACADLLCSALRRGYGSDPSAQPTGNLAPAMTDPYNGDRKAANRILSAIAAAIRSAASADSAPDHVKHLRWDFTDATLGDSADLSGTVFGPGTYFHRTQVGGTLVLRGSTFFGNLELAEVSAPFGVDLRGVKIRGLLQALESEIANCADAPYGLYLESAEVGGLVVEDVKSKAPLHLDAATFSGHVIVRGSTFSSVCFIDSRCDSSVNLSEVVTTGFICLRRIAARKGVSLVKCDAGAEIEVSSVRTQGSITIERCDSAEVVTGESAGPALWSARD